MDLSREDQVTLARVFMPHVMDAQDELIKSNTRLAYYTSADVAINIFRNREIWMRESSQMNDYQELTYGFNCIGQASDSDAGKRFFATLDAIYPNISQTVLEELQTGLRAISYNTYITCLSEHLDSEDSRGRLSMWRAYGGSTPVAIIMNNAVFVTPTDAIKAFTSAVTYFNQAKFEAQFHRMADSLEQQAGLIGRVGEDIVRNIVRNSIVMGVMCSKHPGFIEEKEWRLVYCPLFRYDERIKKDVESINGVPQVIYKIPLQNVPDEGLVGAEIPELIDRIIVGPCEFPLTAAQALIEELTLAGVADANAKVIMSDIPLRK